MTTANQNAIENFIETLNILFAYLATANLHYVLFEELIEDLSFLLISDISENPIISIYYIQYIELVTGSYLTFDHKWNKEDVFDINENDDRRATDNEIVDNRVVDDNNNKKEGNNQNSDRDYIEEKREKTQSFREVLFLDKT